ncbi:MAG: NAD-dependent epimerase [Bacteroidetes bacterium QS_8_68_15]|nr:MAG: NAD-dependent epimerase [Bacteroidetes bacterium QS_8_68_15]
MQRVLVTGANGQVGSELVEALRERDGPEIVVGADLEAPPARNGAPGAQQGPHEVLDVRDRAALARVMRDYAVDAVFHLASLLSATGEAAPDRAWDVNTAGLKHVLDLAREFGQDDASRPSVRVFWPSSIAAFGPATGPEAPQQGAVLDPQTMYGVTKVSGEFLCRYYHRKYGVDVRSVRYPGLISHAAPPGGGTTDYAPEMCFAAAAGRAYDCFVEPQTRLPMMYMHDALRAALRVMDAPAETLSVRTSYNVGALSFSASALAEALAERAPAGFDCRFAPDPERQQIADSWPAAVHDRPARDDWGWQPRYDLDATVDDMLDHLCDADRPTVEDDE